MAKKIDKITTKVEKAPKKPTNPIVELPGSRSVKKNIKVKCKKCKKEYTIKFTKVKITCPCKLIFNVSIEYNSELRADIVKLSNPNNLTEQEKQNIADKHLTTLDKVKGIVKSTSIQRADAKRLKARKDKQLKEIKEKAKKEVKLWQKHKKK